MALRFRAVSLVICALAPTDARAQCPLESDRVVHAPDDGGGRGRFGYALDAEGDLLAVGQPAYGDSRRSQGGGRVFLYRWRDAGWREVQELRAPKDAICEDEFGLALDFEAGGRTLVIGAPGAAVLDPRDPTEASGAVYVYHRVGREYVLADRLHAPDVQPGAFFGASVALEGDRIVVGASGFDGASADTGAVYVFERRGEFWKFQQELDGSNLGAGARLGSSVTVDGSWIASGAIEFDAPQDSGTVVLYEFDGTNWNERGRLDHDPDVRAYGGGCALQENRLLVTNRTNVGISVLHAYEYDGAVWQRTQDLSDRIRGGEAGAPRILGSSAVVGAWDRTGKKGVLLLRYRGRHWHAEAIAVPPEDDPAYSIGETVAITRTTDGTEVLIGGDWRYDDGVTSGIVESAVVPLLLLDVQPEKVSAGMELSFVGCGAQKQSLGLFALVAIDGVPTFERIAIDTANRFGEFDALFTVPPGLEGLNLKFQAFGTDESGTTVSTQKVKIKFR